MKALSSLILAIFITTLFGSIIAVPAQGQSLTVFGPKTFTRKPGKPRRVTETFSVQEPAGEFTLLIQNGINENEENEEHGENEGHQDNNPSSAVVELNGIRIVGPEDFNQHIVVIDKPVTLSQQNTITVEVRGEPGSALTVSILRGPASSIFPKFTLYTNRNDPELLRSEAPSGEVIEYFGTKDDQGLATALKVIRVQSATGEVTTLFLDDRSRPTLIEAPNGLLFKIRWQTNTSIVVTVTTDDALFQIDLPFNLSRDRDSKAMSSLPLMSHGAMTALKGNPFHHSLLPAIVQQGTRPSTSLVSVRRCGSPVNNADVSIVATTQNHPPITGFGNLVGNGIYSVNLPTFESTSLARQEQKCRSVARVIGFACNIFNNFVPFLEAFICPAITIALAADPATIAFAPFAPAACAAAINLTKLACTAGFNGPVPTPLNDSSPFISFVCGLVRRFGEAADRSSATPIDLSASAKIPGVPGALSQYSPAAPPFGPFPNFFFDFPCQRQQCVPGLGGQYFSDGRDVKVTILPFEADFTDEIRLLSPVNRVLGTNRDVGRVVLLGNFRPGAELIFGIFARDTGQTFKMGPPLRNPDRIAHARVECLGDGKAKVFFEDNLGGGDRDFDDAVLQISSGP
jgi:hypothetical protein